MSATDAAAAAPAPNLNEMKDKTSADYYFGQARAERVGPNAGRRTQAGSQLYRTNDPRCHPMHTGAMCAQWSCNVSVAIVELAAAASCADLPRTPPHARSPPFFSRFAADSYSHFGIHEEMLKDSVRTRTSVITTMHSRLLPMFMCRCCLCLLVCAFFHACARHTIFTVPVCLCSLLPH